MARTAQQLLEKLNRQMSAGQATAALKTAKLGLKQFPQEIAFANAAGLSSANAGQHAEAAAFFDRALKRAPDNVELQDNLAQALVLAGAYAKAEAFIDKCLPTRRDPSNLFYLRAMSAMQQEALEEAIDALNTVLDTRPEHLRCLRMRAGLNAAAGFRNAAIADYAHLARLEPHETAHVIQQANLLIQNMDLTGAAQIMDAARKSFGDRPELTEHSAVIAMMTGDLDKARALFAQVTQQNPGSGNAWISSAELCDAADAALLSRQLGNITLQSGLSTSAKGQLEFAQASLCRKTGDIQAEANALRKANATFAKLRPWNAKAAQARFNTLTGPQPDLVGEKQAHPVFVIGLPRSGTSLCDRVLSAHPEISGIGEFVGGGRVQNALLAGRTPVADLYLRGLPDRTQNATRFCDKLPDNYKLVGPLAMLFPKARFVLMQREPRAIALSMWRAYFAEPGLDYTFDFKAMAHEMNLFARYVSHWQENFADRMLLVAYEDLVRDVQAVSKTMAGFCDLDWHPDMASPQKNADAVLTTSVLQAREAVHTRSVAGWQVHEELLQPLVRRLDPQFWPQISSNSPQAGGGS